MYSAFHSFPTRSLKLSLPEKVTVEVVGNDTYVEEKELDNLMSEAEKLEEEFEDDFDPMLA